MDSAPLDPDTAATSQSIWQGIDRAALENQAKDLYAKHHVAGHRSYAVPPASERDRLYPLPFEVEKSLADDIAFIAAYLPQVDSVTAAVIEMSASESSLMVKLAANEGVASVVTAKFNDMFEVLRKHARKDVSRDYCQERLFDLIVQLNGNKILGRLGSKKFKRPDHLTKLQGPLPQRLRHTLSTHIDIGADRPDVKRLNDQIGKFEAAFTHLESGNSPDLVANIENVVQQAFSLNGDGSGLSNFLRTLGCPESILDTRSVRDVTKVSNYWRISRHLAVCSQRFRPLFAGAAWTSLPHYKASLKSQIIGRQHVHAEVQLLVHYEVVPRQLIPRAIGVSKVACFLCDSLIKAHGCFFIAGAHRQVFPQWAVPDLREFTMQTVQHFRQALLQVQQEVNQEWRNAQKRHTWRPFPPQSAVDLNVVHLVTPSISTLRPLQDGGSSNDSGPVTSSNSSRTSTLHQHQTAGVDEQANAELLQSIPHQSSPSAQEVMLEETHVELDMSQATSDHTAWIQILASFSTSPAGGLLTSSQHQSARASITLEPTSGSECQRTFQLDDIPYGEALVLQRSATDRPQELSFILVNGRGREILVRCRWHIAD